MANLTVPIIIDWKAIEEYLAQHDIVEVVRCKDCKDWDRTWITHSPDIHDCPFSSIMTSESFFCAYGERRTDESNSQTGGD